jgi:endonuclease/exonuclease/phosphatase family metal-dependent hydrolase
MTASTRPTAITDHPDDVDIVDDLRRLREALDRDLPERTVDHNLLIGTWNLRHFGGLTSKWRAGPNDSPKRDLHSLLCIVEVLSRFDVVAIQEVKGNLRALRHALKALNHPDPNWGIILTDVARGSSGNDERMAFLFDTRRVKPCGLAAELVMPQNELGLTPGSMSEQFARTPYAVSFYSGGQTFILVTLHIKYGNRAEERVPELKAIAQWMADWANDVNAYHHNLIALGDFNIERNGDPLYQAFTSTGLQIPEELQHLPRTIFGSAGKQHRYDQIAWFTRDSGVPALDLEYTRRGGIFDFVPYVMQGMELRSISWKISDHYPLWAEFLVRGKGPN